MPVETYPFDPARYLQSDEERAIYLAEAIETNDPEFIADALAVVARSREAQVQTPAAVSEDNPLLHGTVGLGSLLRSMRQLGLRLTVSHT